MTLTPIQQAICAIIHESGGWWSDSLIAALRRCAVDSVHRDVSFIQVDGHHITKQGYQIWLSQKEV